MKKLLSATFALSLLLSAPGTQAFYDNAGDLLKAMEYNGSTPRNFTMKLYSHIEGMHVTVNANGAVEGRTAESMKAKMSATVDVKENNQTSSMNMDFVMIDKTIYMKLNRMDINQQNGLTVSIGLSEDMIGKWIAVPLEANGNTQMTSQQQIAVLIQTLQAEGVSITENDLQTVGKDLLNAVFQMDRTQFKGGYAYSVTLKKDFLRQAFMQIKQLAQRFNFTEMNSMNLSATELQQAQQLINDSVYVHMKYDTNKQGYFKYGKFYFAFDHDGTYLAIEGKAESQKSGVNVYVPKDYEIMNLQEIQEMNSVPMQPSSTSPMPPWDANMNNSWDNDDWSDDWEKPIEEDEWEMDSDDWDGEDEWNDNMQEWNTREPATPTISTRARANSINDMRRTRNSRTATPSPTNTREQTTGRPSRREIQAGYQNQQERRMNKWGSQMTQ